jgi:hypothetical protein
MMSNLTRCCVIAALVCSATAPLGARVVPASVSRVLSPAQHPRTTLDARAQRGAMPHAIYGTVVKITGSLVLLRARNGVLWQIDAAPALAADLVSAPLFVGKLVVAEGLTRAGNTLTAARISRLARLDGLAPDR